jgi:tetratricopeptide (TPR) repeat protein
MAIAEIEVRSVEQLLARRQEVSSSASLAVGLPDVAAYYYLKEASFLSRKEERWSFYFFQGLNANPQNLSIYLRDEAQRENKTGKEKLVKGVFAIYDLFGRSDVVIEINIPGNLRIYRLLHAKKELVSNEEIDLMYLSSAFRTMYQHNLPWGRSYLLFHDAKHYLQELAAFLGIAFRSLLARDIHLGPEYEAAARVKGSHACSLILAHARERRLVRQTIELIEELFGKHKEYRECHKYGVLLAELYVEFGKPSRSLEIVFGLLALHPRDAYLLYYQARYLLESGLCEQALTVANSIVQFNQLEVWLLLGQVHLELKNYGQLLICLNHAVRLSKIKAAKPTDAHYRAFEELGKVRPNSSSEGIERSPKLLYHTETPLSIMVKEVEEKNKFLLERSYWKLNANEKTIYGLVQDLRYRL